MDFRMGWAGTLAIALGLGLGAASVLTPAQAQTLLVITNSLGEWGDMSQSFEGFAGDLVGDTIAKSGQYRKVYEFNAIDAEARNQSFTQFWNQLVAERQPGEQIDIFEQDHTTERLLGITDPATGADATPLIPARFIRRFYSSGCSNWGQFTAVADGSNIKVDPSLPYIQDLRKAEVGEYVIHANDNNQSLFVLPLLLSEMRTGESWLTAGLHASNRFDEMVGGEASRILSSLDAMAGVAQSLLGGFSASDLDSTGLLISRFVLGGTAMPQFMPRVSGQTMWRADDEAMLAPTGKLLAFQKSDCPNVYGISDNSACKQAPAPGAIDSIHETVDVFQRLFALLEDSDGCVDPTPFSHFLEGLTDSSGSSPRFEKVCFTREGDNTLVLSWRLAPTTSGAILQRLAPNSYVASQDIWKVRASVPMAMNGASVEGISLDRDGEVRIHFAHGVAHASITGIGLDGISADGLDGVPRFLRSVGITGFELDDDLNARVNASAAVFAIPLQLGLVSGAIDSFKIGPIRIE